MFADDVEKLSKEIVDFMVNDVEIRLLRFFTNNVRQPKFNFHWLREISSFEVIGDLTLDLREV